MDDTSDNYSGDGSLDDSTVGSTLDTIGNLAGFVQGVASQAQAVFQPQTQTYVSQPTAAPVPSTAPVSTFGAIFPAGLVGWVKTNPILAGILAFAGLGLVGGLAYCLFKK